MVERLLWIGSRLLKVALLALTIAGGLASMLALTALGPSWESERLRRDRAALDLENVSASLSLYRTRYDRFPTQAQGLDSLVHEDLLDAVPHDPWGHTYLYSRGAFSYQLASLGADGRPGGAGENSDLCRHSAQRVLTARGGALLEDCFPLGRAAYGGPRGTFHRPSRLWSYSGSGRHHRSWIGIALPCS